MIGKRLTSWFDQNSLPRWLLLLLALAELLICLDYHEQRWDRVITARPLPPEHAGEGLVIQWNGLHAIRDRAIC